VVTQYNLGSDLHGESVGEEADVPGEFRNWRFKDISRDQILSAIHWASWLGIRALCVLCACRGPCAPSFCSLC
jgi:hypothetical protein